MPLVTNDKSSIYGGVNQQAAEHRLETQVEECINAYPTVGQGLLKRNPTQKLDVVGIDFDDNMYTYEYDRGLAGDSEEKYSIQITDDGMSIVNVISGEVYNATNGNLLFGTTDAEAYLQPFINNRGYAAVTIKDTTFIANKNIQPLLNPYITGDVDSSPTSVTVHQDIIWFNKIPPKSSGSIYQYNYAPSSAYQADRFLPLAFGTSSTTVVTVDGNTAILNTAGGPLAALSLIMSYNEYISNVMDKVVEAIDPLTYVVDIITDATRKGIRIKRIDGTAIVTSLSIQIDAVPATAYQTLYTSVEADYYNSTASTSYAQDIVLPSTAYAQEGHIWIKSSNPTSAYTYSYTIQSDTTTHSGSVSNTTTEGAIVALKASINANANFLAESTGGSVLRVKTQDGADMVNIYMGDTYGDQASFGWTNEVVSSNDLPKNMPYSGAAVKVIGSNNGSDFSYWLKFTDGQWREALGFGTKPLIEATTMPHVLVRNADNTFTFSAYDQWSSKLVGDDDTNPPPSFTQDGNVIKDIFFFKNRLGFITDRTVVMSEVGQYGNFFRKTVVTLLDSDRIDTSVDTTKAIKLEYATYLEDSLMLFSDKAQFKLEGGKILSPKDIQVSQTSAYEININIRPIFMNDKLFFVAKRGDYSAVMQYFVSGDGRISEAIDITAHTEKYIPQDVKSLSGSSINNMLFMLSPSTPNTIYVYKYLDSGDQRIQSAWFKWTYNGHVYGAFSLGKNLNILINRTQASAVTDWVLGTGIWEGDKLWTSDGIWYGTPDELLSTDNFEVQPIYPQDHTGYFVDASQLVEDTDVIVNITSTALSSPVINASYIQTFEAVRISLLDENIVSYTITANIQGGGSYVSTDNDLIVPKEVRAIIESVEVDVLDASPVVFNGISCVYSTDLNNELLYNNDFSNGMDNWTFTDWDINYGTVDIGSIIPTSIDLGEWVLKIGEKSQNRGSLKMKTCQVNSDDGSDFFLEVRDVKRDDVVKIPSEYTVDRKPMIYGDSKNVRLSIENSTTSGFKINSVSLEGNYNSRNRRV